MSEPKQRRRTSCVLGTTAPAPNVVVVDVAPLEGEREMLFLITSDVHWDNPHCDRELYRKHLEQARERGAAIIDIGDWYCAMQGKFDKRSSKSSIRPEHQCGDYLDALTRTGIEFLKPFADRIVMMGHGNHETSIRERHEVDLTERLVSGLSLTTNHTVRKGGYSGWVVIRMQVDGTRTQVLKLWYIHGYGGGGPVTVDNIQAQRQMGYVDADIMVSGHTHDSWTRDFVRVGLDRTFMPVQRLVEYAKVGTYKDEYGDGAGGWHVITGKPPKPVTAKWLKIWLERDRHNGEDRRILRWEFSNAR